MAASILFLFLKRHVQSPRHGGNKMPTKRPCCPQSARPQPRPWPWPWPWLWPRPGQSLVVTFLLPTVPGTATPLSKSRCINKRETPTCIHVYIYTCTHSLRFRAISDALLHSLCCLPFCIRRLLKSPQSLPEASPEQPQNSPQNLLSHPKNFTKTYRNQCFLGEL